MLGRWNEGESLQRLLVLLGLSSTSSGKQETLREAKQQPEGRAPRRLWALAPAALPPWL